ncbi:GEVED domain-containing protein [Psychroserpens sp. Hel_I_66]|uniref:GEVED domain-containing protein n=1 Tax=Psychroserpens sp. Hel_I_66 TaxID=1250004 RepID=UPI000646956B|nr:GEVED domain-containing protein [Psychroserpens sp. Hel_I_66]
MKKLYFTVLLTLITIGSVLSQTTLYSETFTGQNGKGVIGGFFGSTTDLSGVDWTVDVSAANFSDSFFGGNADYFLVLNEIFQSKDTDGNAFWISPSIPISGYTNVTFSLDAIAEGNETGDTFVTQYRVNGGTWTTASTNGNLNGNFNLTVSQVGLTGNNLQIRVRINSSADNDLHAFDNVLVVGTFPCTTTPAEVQDLTATPNSQEVELNWTNSTCFDEVLVVAKEGSAVTAIPTGDGSSYSANATFGFGTTIAANEFVVYKGIGNTETVTNLLNGTPYHFKVFTRKGPNWSNGVSISTIPLINGYCDSNSGDSTFEHISRVRLNTIDNAPSDTGASFYSDFTIISTDLTKQTEYTITIDIVKQFGGDLEFFSVWIDFNGDADFLDPGEQVLLESTNATQVTENFTVPTNSIIGATRMRVSVKYNEAPTPCETGFDTGEVEDYTVNINGSVIYTYDNGWDNDPNGVATSLDAINVVNGEATINLNTKGNTLTVNPSGSLRLNSGTTLQLSESLNMESVSNQYSSLISEGTILGTVNYQRHVNTFATNATTGNNDLISPPLTNATQTFEVFRSRPENANIPSGTIGGVPSFLFGPFNNNTNAYVNFNATYDATILQAGIGYRTASTVVNGSPLVFTGDVLSNVVPVPVSVGTLSQWNLIGNPYPSYLDNEAFLNENITLFDPFAVGIYGYDGTAQNGWTIINLANVAFANNMAPGQGFLFAAGDSGTVNFTPAMRLNSGTDDFIEGRSSSSNHYLKLKVQNASSSFHTDFYFNDSSTRSLDVGYDAKLFDVSLPNLYMYSHLVEDNDGQKMAIQSLATSDLNDVIIPLGIKANQGEQITISIQDTNIPESVDVYLEDTVNNTFTLLNTSDFVITPSTNLSGTGRFFLRFSSEALSTQEETLETIQIYTTKSPKSLFIKGLLDQNTTLEIYDIQGRIILKSKLDNRSNSNEVDVSGFTTGVYMVKLNNGSQQKSQKVIIN